MTVCKIFNKLGEEMVSFDTKAFAKSISIGRSSSCNISLKCMAETNVSREHIVLHKEAGGWLLEATGNSGVYLDGERLKEQVPIEDGQVFRFSQLFLCIGEKNGPVELELAWDAETEDKQHRSAIWPGTNTIGASRDNYITVRTDDISRMHGVIVANGRFLTYKTTFASQQASVNGEAVKGAVELKVGDVLRLADTDISVVKVILKNKKAARAFSTIGAASESGEFNLLTEKIKPKMPVKADDIALAILLVVFIVCMLWFIIRTLLIL